MVLILTGKGVLGLKGELTPPSLNDMRVKQGAVVSKFLTFLNRKKTVTIELYERSFYMRLEFHGPKGLEILALSG